jgi:hypothetical protein
MLGLCFTSFHVTYLLCISFFLCLKMVSSSEFRYPNPHSKSAFGGFSDPSRNRASSPTPWSEASIGWHAGGLHLSRWEPDATAMGTPALFPLIIFDLFAMKFIQN